MGGGGRERGGGVGAPAVERTSTASLRQSVAYCWARTELFRLRRLIDTARAPHRTESACACRGSVLVRACVCLFGDRASCYGARKVTSIKRSKTHQPTIRINGHPGSDPSPYPPLPSLWKGHRFQKDSSTRQVHFIQFFNYMVIVPIQVNVAALKPEFI